LKNIFLKLFGLFSYVFKLIRLEYRKLTFVINANPGKNNPNKETISRSDIVIDFMEVFMPTRFFLLFNVLAFIIFIFLPQGKDVVLIVIEDLSKFNPLSLLSLLFGLVGWSVFAEFGARYKIYITDNSGKSLTGNRVNYRKQLQHFFSMVYLLLPFAIVLFGVMVVTINNSSLFLEDKTWNWPVIAPFAVVMLSLLLTASGIARFYLDKKWIVKFHNRETYLAKKLKLPKEELDWLDKLFGIYNDYVIQIRKESFFSDEHPETGIKTTYSKFTGIVTNLEPNEFPDSVIIKSEQAPKAFGKPVYYSEEYKPDYANPEKFRFEINPAGSYRWMYSNHPGFYKVLHGQLKLVAFSSLLLIILVTISPSSWLGSPGLVCLSFGCWQGVYTGLLFVDFRYRRNFIISARWILVIWFFIVSYINNDHPVRYNEEGKKADNRLSLQNHFSNWFAAHIKDTITNKPISYNNMNKGILKKDTAYPLIFITAEGGALRTGAFTAMLLAYLQDSFPELKNNIYAYSTVSGGSVGVSFFNAINYIDSTKNKADANFNREITRKFFTNDQLSPVIAKLFYGDILNYLWPVQLKKFDRAIALEKAWEHDYSQIFNHTENKNVYSSDFLSCIKPDKLYPAWFINTTEVESGMQCFICNVIPENLLFSKDRDLLSDKIRGGINYSTAVGFSTRFPLFSPSAALKQNDDRTYHYVDGGYVENTGSKTMFEILQSLQDSIIRRNSDSISTTNKHILPILIQLRFGDEDIFSGTGFLNEISSIGNGIYNTRQGNSNIYISLLKTFVEDTLHGRFISIPLEANSNMVPMSWVFSERSMENLQNAINKIMANNLNQLHKNLYLFHLKKNGIRNDTTVLMK
jgi:hypothetical protein